MVETALIVKSLFIACGIVVFGVVAVKSLFFGFSLGWKLDTWRKKKFPKKASRSRYDK